MGDPRSSKPALAGLWFLIATTAGILVLGDLNSRMGDARRLERDAVLLETEVASLEGENARLQTAVAGATSEALVGRWARREAKMVLPGERLIVPLAVPGDVPAPTPTPTPIVEPPSNLEVWWELLTGR